jgi:hypothetical protein
VLVAAAVLLVSMVGVADAFGSARIAHALSVADSAHLRFLRETTDSLLVEEGTATGALPGRVRAQLSVGANISGTYTITTRAGSLTGYGTGVLHSSGEYASFGGSITVTHGTGRYAHAHGHGGFYGTINRSTYATVLQTTGTLDY